MKTFEGVYANGHIHLKEDIKLAENLTVYVLVPDGEHRTGIDPDCSCRIQETGISARKRVGGFDKTKYRKLVDRLFEDLGISIQPIEAEQLQARMEHLGLEENEWSRAVIEAREE